MWFIKKSLRKKLSTVLLLLGHGLSLYEILLGLFSVKKRTELRKYASRVVALNRYGIKFSNKIGVGEVIVDKIYTQYNDFIPSEYDTVIDAGAQYGDYSILCEKYYGANVIAFEPLSSNFTIFRENVKLNKLTTKKFKLYNIALGNKTKKIEISYSNDMANNTNSGSKQIVMMRRLDSLKLKPTILKIDVEGFEIEVLKGAMQTIKKNHPKIIIETHSLKLKKEVLRILKSLDYSVVHEGRVVTSDLPKMDIVQNLFLY